MTIQTRSARGSTAASIIFLSSRKFRHPAKIATLRTSKTSHQLMARPRQCRGHSGYINVHITSMSTSIIGPVTPRQECQERQVQLELAATTSVNTHMHEAQGWRLIGCDQTTTPGVRVPLAAKSGGGGSKEVLVKATQGMSAGTTSDQRRGAGSPAAHGNTAVTLCPCSPRAATRLPATSWRPTHSDRERYELDRRVMQVTS